MQVGDHDMWDHKSDCQEYKDCPGNCKNDQGCKDACALKTCYYYHCDNYKVSPVSSGSNTICGSMWYNISSCVD
jgi:hypothetical protein